MSVDKFNSEGYYDPTAYEAMSIIEKEERALRAFRPRQRSRRKAGDYVSVWRCASAGNCNSPSIKEEKLKQLCAEALGTDGFDESAFREQIACIHITAPFRLSIHFVDGHTFEGEWENKRQMPKHSEERKEHMRQKMIENWRKRRGESNDHSGNDQPVHSDTD